MPASINLAGRGRREIRVRSRPRFYHRHRLFCRSKVQPSRLQSPPQSIAIEAADGHAHRVAERPSSRLRRRQPQNLPAPPRFARASDCLSAAPAAIRTPARRTASRAQAGQDSIGGSQPGSGATAPTSTDRHRPAPGPAPILAVVTYEPDRRTTTQAQPTRRFARPLDCAGRYDT